MVGRGVAAGRAYRVMTGVWAALVLAFAAVVPRRAA